jgi:hypothetical protein
MNFLPPPSILPFERFRPSDGLLINAERWRTAHDYHRSRQNFHYQSLHQPGIVCGLGVTLINPDSDEPEQYRDGRGVKLQPGIALDLKGNPIIVPKTENVQISVEPPTIDPLTVYLVVSYRDPDELRIREGEELVREQFRIDVKTRPPSELEVEVCRILLPPNQEIKLKPTEDVFFPVYFNLDFRFRQWATLRPLGMVRLAQIEHDDPNHNLNFPNLDFLLNATEILYPQLRGIEPVGLIPWQKQGQPQGESQEKVRWKPSDLEAYDLLYITGQKLRLSPQQRNALRDYINNGGVLFVDSLGNEITNYIKEFVQTELNNEFQPVRGRHPLRRTPFLFAAFANGGMGQPVDLQIARLPRGAKSSADNPLIGGGVIICTGNLASVWGVDQKMQLSREILRSAQELGLNILHYAWTRRNMTRLGLGI